MYPSYEPWTIVREIGSGSFGTVYEIERRDAFDVYKAALKVISIPHDRGETDAVRSNGMSDESVSEYFQSEAEEIVKEIKMMARFKGITNIVSYEDHLVKRHEDGIGWDIMIRMELLTSLTKYLTENTITRQEIIRLGIDICNALDRCQKYNIIHRDIKPDNIFVSRQGDYKLGDFGIARTAEKTLSGMSQKGTPLYMAPEVYKGEAYGHTVDIYSLGIVMYRLLNNNRIPFLPPYPQSIKYKDQQLALVKRMSGEPFPMPRGDNGRLAEIVLKACNYLPKDRYSSPARMREELQEILLTEKEVKGGPIEQPLVIPLEKTLTSPSFVKSGEILSTQEMTDSQGIYQGDYSRTVSASKLTIFSEEKNAQAILESESDVELKVPDLTESNSEFGMTDISELNLELVSSKEEAFRETEVEALEKSVDDQKPGMTENEEGFELVQNYVDGNEIETKTKKELSNIDETKSEPNADQEFKGGEEKESIEEQGSTYGFWTEQGSELEESTFFEATVNQESTCVGNTFSQEDIKEPEKPIASQEKKGNGIIVRAMIVAITVIVIVMAVWKPWAKPIMPELVGKFVDEVETTKIAKRDISIIEEWSDQKKAGVIISQTPEEGAELEKDQIIELVVSKGKEQIIISNLVNKDYSEVQKSELAKKLSVSTTEEYNDTVEKGHIISQAPSSGKTVYKGDKLKLVVSKGREPVTVTDYIGKIYEDIKGEAENSGLIIIVKKKYNDTYEKGVVFKTKPASGKTVYKGDTLKIYVSKGVEMVKVPSLVGLSSTDADKKLADAGLTKGQVTNQYSNSAKSGIVISQGAEAGSKMKKGDALQYSVSIGPKPKAYYNNTGGSTGGARKKRKPSTKIIID